MKQQKHYTLNSLHARITGAPGGDKVACISMDRIQKQPNQEDRCGGLLSEMILGDEAIHHIC